ncbi:MerR family transcriptional regulator [Kaistia defluvii]|uniref:MerR family transcriptional regulator n=1 Tax=Kaistia defluvii TaxID=410841 RepID=UPI00339535CA
MHPGLPLNISSVVHSLHAGRVGMIRYSIGELASEFSLTNRTLRFWEEADLVSPIRRGQSRIYTEADRNWVRAIAAWSAAGLTLREIKAMRDMPVAER